MSPRPVSSSSPTHSNTPSTPQDADSEASVSHSRTLTGENKSALHFTIDQWAAVECTASIARWANRALILFLFLFALTVPHSIAAAQTSLNLGILAWLARDLTARRLHFARTIIDWPLACFAALTILSSIFSVEPSISLPKLKTLGLFSLVYLLATNVSVRGVRLLLAALLISSLVGVSFSLAEKLRGRGMVIAEIAPDSPLSNSGLQVGDVIWMIARKRVSTPEEAGQVIRHQRVGNILDVEALHAGDPVPVTITVTEEMQAQENPLGIQTNGRSRQFRVSGFSRQFLTYAEQMQILALLAFGGLLAGLRRWRQHLSARRWVFVSSLLFVLYALALVLTATRAVMVSLAVALFLVALCVGGVRASAIALVATLALIGLGIFTVTTARQEAAISFRDDSTARRVAYMQAGLRIIPAHPLLGVGMDAHKRHWHEWGFPGDYITHTHSTPIQLALDRGIPALFCYGWLLAVLWLGLWQAYQRAKTERGWLTEALLLGAFAALSGFSVSSLANYNFGDSEALMMMLLVLSLALIVAKPQPKPVASPTVA